MIAAAVLTKEEVVLEGCPKISDVEDMAEIVRSLGGTVWWERNALHMNCEKIEKSRVEGALSKRLRASLLFLGSLLARTGEAYFAGAGGCRIGKRPTDLHQRAMELLGAEVFEEDGTIRASAGWTGIFIYPGYDFKIVDAIITNFHLPKSTLIMLISAFAGRNFVLNAYKTAVEMKYRFFSFGDAMFIRRKQPDAERAEELKELEELDRQREAEGKA